MATKLGTILPPEKPSNVPESAQWLSGQGAGVWFYIEAAAEQHQYFIQRYSAHGQLDCEGLFQLEGADIVFDINKAYSFAHISHCAKCRIEQNDVIVVFNRITA